MSAWTPLGTPRQELTLDNTLPTGQSFRWRKTGASTYTGVIGQRVVQVKQLDDDVAYRVISRGGSASAGGDATAIANYFNLSTNLSKLSQQWAAADTRFCSICTYIPGARMLRQDPLECAFQFICSSNNHISRIHGMVERLCQNYGTPLTISSTTAPPSHHLGSTTPPVSGPPLQHYHLDPQATPPPTPFAPAQDPNPLQTQTLLVATPPGSSGGLGGLPEVPPDEEDGLPPQSLSFFAFPTLSQLAGATEEALRADGFGYRARYITGSVAELMGKEGGGAEWLLALRKVPYEQAVEQLTSLPGIGPKVAACVALFSLDKHQAVPVDTHVWALATRYYAPRLAGKTLNPKLHGEVQRVFEERFGPYAGWAHNTLFISELASHRDLLPGGLQSGGGRGGAGTKGKRGKAKAGPSGADDSGAEDATEDENDENGFKGLLRGLPAAAKAAAAAAAEAVMSGGDATAEVVVAGGATACGSSRRKRVAAAGVARAVKAAAVAGEGRVAPPGPKKKRRSRQAEPRGEGSSSD